MVKQGWIRHAVFKFIFLVMVLVFLSLSGCVSSIWTGATLIYNRHNLYKKWDDYSLYFKVNNAIAIDNLFKNNRCVIDITVFHGDVLLAGHVPNREMRDELYKRLNKVSDYRRLFRQIAVNRSSSNWVQDAWITTKIRSQIVADGSIDPNEFKVITSDHMVYLMGDVRSEQADKVIRIARQVSGVVRVVTLLKYYAYQSNKIQFKE